MERIPKTAFLPANMDGCSLYRMFMPHLSIPGSKFIWKPGAIPLEEFGDCEVVVVQRQVSEGNLIAIHKMKELGMKVVYDTDDNLWSLPAANPGKKIFEQHQAGFLKCASECSAITVSTQGLASAVKTAIAKDRAPFKGEIIICPNAMDTRLFRPASVKRDDKIVIGWAGSNTHGEDVKEAWHILPEIAKEFPNVHFEFVGMDAPAGLQQYRDRVKLRRFVPVGEYPARLSTWGWDITLAPLADNRFNRSKSNIKLLEAAALGIPCLVSMVQPYEEFCALDPELRWLMCFSENSWREKLRTLVMEPERCKHFASRIQRIVSEWYSIEKLKDNWIHAVQSVC